MIGVAESIGHCRYKLSHMYTISVEYLQPPERSQCAVDRHDKVCVTIAIILDQGVEGGYQYS